MSERVTNGASLRSRDVPGYPDRFIDFLARRGEKAIVLNGAIYMLYSSMVVPFGPADRDYTLSREDAARALELLGGTLVQTTGGFQPAPREWYAVVCRQFTDVEHARPRSVRREIRRGLRQCEVRRIGGEELARAGYEAYVKAQERYGGSSVPSPASFAAHVGAAEGFDDILHYWAVYCDRHLAGYSSNYIFGTTEASYSDITFDPGYFRSNISYALVHHMNEHYLAGRRVAYVNDGFRSLLHPSNIQGFLERNFNFEKAYTPLDVTYRAPYGALIRATFPLRRLIGRLDRRLGAVYELERVVRAQGGPRRR